MRRKLKITTAEEIRKLLWPDFVVRDGCVFVAFQIDDKTGGAPSGGRTERELFINHTHLFDEFESAACSRVETGNHHGPLTEIENNYDSSHAEFQLTKSLGETMARMWAAKLKQDFPYDRFRVYYLHYDDACLRFHKVRADEDVWLTDEQFLSQTGEVFKDGILYDTDCVDRPVRRYDSRPNAGRSDLIKELPEDFLITFKGDSIQ